MYKVMYRGSEESIGIIWWKIVAWRMKEVRKNDRMRCLIWNKE
jgi:hypothetical protein